MDEPGSELLQAIFGANVLPAREVLDEQRRVADNELAARQAEADRQHGRYLADVDRKDREWAEVRECDIRKTALHEPVLLEYGCIRSGKPESLTPAILRVADELAAWLRKGADE